MTIWGPGNSFLLPRLLDLANAQRGYGVGLRGEALTGWNAEWLVVADGSGEPLVFDSASQGWWHVVPSDEGWETAELFESLVAMSAGLATISAKVKQGADREAIAVALREVLGEEGPDAGRVLDQFGFESD